MEKERDGRRGVAPTFFAHFRAMATGWDQATVTLRSRPRGCHVVTREIEDG